MKKKSEIIQKKSESICFNPIFTFLTNIRVSLAQADELLKDPAIKKDLREKTLSLKTLIDQYGWIIKSIQTSLHFINEDLYSDIK